jgi:hypothetical protein
MDVIVHQKQGKKSDGSVVTSTPDPYAMDIDATRTNSTNSGNGKTRDEFLKLMRNRCFCCGASGHMKYQCSHKDSTCNYCARKGHLDRVCQDKFLGLEKNRGKRSQGQRIAATTGNDFFTLFPNEPSTLPSFTPNNSIAGPSTVSDPTAQLNALQSAMAQQAAILASFMKKDF